MPLGQNINRTTDGVCLTKSVILILKNQDVILTFKCGLLENGHIALKKTL